MFSLIPELYAMAPQGEGGGGIVGQIGLFAAIFAIFYFLVIRPQQKKTKQLEKMISELAKGDQVVTAAGIYGTINKYYNDKDYILLEIADKTIVKIKKAQVTEVVKKK
ncbi:MAG: preprotein translocase subunit YajC [Proteobacteria bacterium]|nr:preprotein translocase subunit YajC [Pseudomonadota bacterium]